MRQLKHVSCVGIEAIRREATRWMMRIRQECRHYPVVLAVLNTAVWKQCLFSSSLEETDLYKKYCE
jgi:hypothetical protein